MTPLNLDVTPMQPPTMRGGRSMTSLHTIPRRGSAWSWIMAVVSSVVALALAGCGGSSGSSASASPSPQPTTTASSEVVAEVNAVATTYFTDFYSGNFAQAQAAATGPALLRMQYYTAVTTVNGIPAEDLPSKLQDVNIQAQISSGAQSGETLTTPGPVAVSYASGGESFSETKQDLTFQKVGGKWLLSDWRTKLPDGVVIPPTNEFWFPGDSTQTVENISASALLGVGWPDQAKSMEFFDWLVSVSNLSDAEAKLTGFTVTTDTGVTGNVTVAADGTLTSDFPANLNVELAADSVYPAGGTGWVYISFPASSGVRGGKVALVFSTPSGEVRLAVDLPTVTVPAGYGVTSPSATASASS